MIFFASVTGWETDGTSGDSVEVGCFTGKTGGRWGGFRGSGKDGSCVGIVREEMDGRVGEMGKSGSRGIGMGGTQIHGEEGGERQREA